METAILAAILGALISGSIGLIGAILTLKEFKLTKRKTFAIMIPLVFVIILLGAVFLIPEAPYLNISTPLPASTVGSSVQVKGESHNIPAGNKIYVIVYVTAHNVNRYYPNLSPVSVQANGDWYDSAVIGALNDVNATFFIFATLVNPQGQQALESYIQNSERNNNIYSGMLSLPEGITIYSMTGVIRSL